MLLHLGYHAFCSVQRSGIAVGTQEEGICVLCWHALGLQNSRIN